MKFKDQIGGCFTFEDKEWIYEGIVENPEGMKCDFCGKKLFGKLHLFNSSEGYNNMTYESRFFGTECVKKIIGAGMSKD